MKRALCSGYRKTAPSRNLHRNPYPVSDRVVLVRTNNFTVNAFVGKINGTHYAASTFQTATVDTGISRFGIECEEEARAVACDLMVQLKERYGMEV